MLTNIIIILIVLAIIGSIVFYLAKEKKKGAKCIGCPYSKECQGHCDGCHEFAQKDNKE